MRKKELKNNNKNGFSLLETLVAISILMMTIVGPLSLASKGIVFADYVKDEITGFYLAQEAIEAIRNIRDSNIKNNRDWLDKIKESCMSPDGATSVPCRIDIWRFSEADYGLKPCSSPCIGETRENFERMKFVDVGTGDNRVKLYGYDFPGNIVPLGRTPEDSIFSRRITIKNITNGYLARTDIPEAEKTFLQFDPSGIDEINVTVEVFWIRSSLRGAFAERSIRVSENMFSI